MNLIKKEPVATAYTGFVVALVAVLAIFGVHLTTDQIAAAVAVLGLVGPVVAAWVRNKVSPVATSPVVPPK